MTGELQSADRRSGSIETDQSESCREFLVLVLEPHPPPVIHYNPNPHTRTHLSRLHALLDGEMSSTPWCENVPVPTPTYRRARTAGGGVSRPLSPAELLPHRTLVGHVGTQSLVHSCCPLLVHAVHRLNQSLQLSMMMMMMLWSSGESFLTVFMLSYVSVYVQLRHELF